MVATQLFTSLKDSWETPDALYDTLDEEFHFCCDVCANPDNARHPCFFSKDNSCLEAQWPRGCCWMNPPYGRDIGTFLQKAVTESKKGSTVVCLLPSRTDTVWWHTYVKDVASEVRFIKGRLRFKGARYAAPFPSVIVVYKGA